MRGRHNGGMDTIAITTAARALAAEAMMISRVAHGDEREALHALARALRDPARVARLLDMEADAEAAHAITA